MFDTRDPGHLAKWRPGALPRRKPAATLVSLGILISLAVAACGSTSGSAASNASSTSSTSTKASGLLGKVESSHSLSIAMSAFAPQDFQNKSGTWTGYDVDILRGFAKTLGAKLKINAMPFSASIQAVSSKRDDITIDVYYKKSRAKVVSFSRPMLNYNDAIAVRASKPEVSAPTVAALTGKSIAVVTGSAEVPEAKAVPKAHVVQYNNINDSFLALSSGRVAADIQPDVDISWSKRKDSSLDIKLLGPVPTSIAPPIQSLRGYYGVPKGSYSSGFLTKLNAYLKKISCNGTEQSILNNYGMSNPVYLKGICSAPSVYSGTS